MNKLPEKSETYQALQNRGKTIIDAHRMAGFKVDVNGSALYKIEGNIRNYALTDRKLSNTSKRVAKQILEISEETLKNRRDGLAIQALCVKESIQIIEGTQDRIEPKKNLNVNATVNANLDETMFDYAQFRRKE